MINFDEKIKEAYRSSCETYRLIKAKVLEFKTQKNAPIYDDAAEIGLLKKMAVELLLSFLNIHDGDVGLVISSSWRKNTLNDTISFFKEHELVAPLSKYIVGITPRLYNGVRGDEIDWFLDSIERPEIEKFAIKSLDVDRFCIVDDEDDMLDYQFDNLIHVDSYFGLTESDIDEIEELLYER